MHVESLCDFLVLPFPTSWSVVPRSVDPVWACHCDVSLDHCVCCMLTLCFLFVWLPIVDSNHASRINSPLPSPRLLMGNVFGGTLGSRTLSAARHHRGISNPVPYHPAHVPCEYLYHVWWTVGESNSHLSRAKASCSHYH